MTALRYGGALPRASDMSVSVTIAARGYLCRCSALVPEFSSWHTHATAMGALRCKPLPRPQTLFRLQCCLNNLRGPH